ncbi:9550_t:CDS:2 [Diversispora eburnea]|uniref:9550_t:CDS:1 n=1 Tax=Diversispora eburnea TaxID=1213867 RepID=A0A9N8YJS4_9GLOM|nr:9550_t:CDS:2 [Diversispora eburnea]
MSPLLIVYDIGLCYIKYTEGFLLIPNTGEIITKPQDYWNDSNRKLLIPFNYILCANFSAQTCLLFLLQAFWNYLANSIAKTTFMSSFEFKSYIIYSVFSAALFPLLQWMFRCDKLYTEVIPRLAYSGIMIIIALLGIISDWRFSKLLRATNVVNASQLNKELSSSLDVKSKNNNFLDSYNNGGSGNNGGKRWSKYIPVSEISLWSSQVSSRNDNSNRSIVLDILPPSPSFPHPPPPIKTNFSHSLKYPSSPVMNNKRNSFNSLTSSSPLSSPLPIQTNPNLPMIKITDSLTSLRAKKLLQDNEKNEKNKLKI